MRLKKTFYVSEANNQRETGSGSKMRYKRNAGVSATYTEYLVVYNRVSTYKQGSRKDKVYYY